MSTTEKNQTNTKNFSDDSDIEDYPDDQKMDQLLDSLGLKSEAKKSSGLGVERRSEVNTSVGQNSAFPLQSKKKATFTQLLGPSEASDKTTDLQRQVERMQKSKKTLATPLSKVEAERVERKVEYVKTKKQVTKWDTIVQENRKSDHLVFPQDHQPLRAPTIDEHFNLKGDQTFKEGSLQDQVMAMLNSSEYSKVNKETGLYESQEKLLAKFSLEEARRRRAELQKHRVMMGHWGAKMKRQGKIKSKSYRKHLRKQRQKQQERQEAQEGGEDETKKEKLKVRAEERASLRHHGSTGKWSRNRAIIAKHDAVTREKMNEQHAKRVELMQRTLDDDVDDSTDEDDDDVETNDDNDNDDVTMTLPQSLVSDNPWTFTNEEKKNAEETREGSDMATEEDSEEEEKSNKEDKISSRVESLRTWLNSSTTKQQANSEAKLDEALTTLREETEAVNKAAAREQQNSSRNLPVIMRETEESGLQVGDDQSVQVETQLDERQDGAETLKIDNSTTTEIKDDTADDVESDDDVLQPAKPTPVTIAEVFADEDMARDFATGGRGSGNNDQNKMAPMEQMDGFDGQWAGAGINVNKKRKARKRKRRMMMNDKQLQEEAKEYDEEILRKVAKKQGWGLVHLNQSRDAQLAQHQVSKLPFPYTNPEQFERVLSRPIGKEWNTPSVYKKNIQERVRTYAGTIINPMHPQAADAQIGEKKKKKLKFNKNKKEKHYKNVADSLAGAKIR